MLRVFVGLLVTVYSFLSFGVVESNSILADANQVYQEIQNPQIFNANTCAQYIVSRADYIRTKPFDFYVPKTSAEKAAFANYAKDVTQKIFNLRILLKGKLTEFFNAQTLSEDCTTAIREAMRVARTTEEMLLVYQHSNKLIEVSNPKNSNGTLMGDYPQTFKNPKYYTSAQEVELKSGDLIMMRGAAVVSALIARIGDEDGLFSHIGVFYIDPATQKKFIIESLIETGLVVTPYEEWMKIVEARVAVYRYPNANVALNAAQKLYDHYLNYKNQNGGKTVPYDFSMNLNSYDKMFCSEVATLAYDLGSEGRIKIPTFLTSLSKIKDSNFVQRMGIHSMQIFSPNDMEIEPRFDLVAEFRRVDRLLVLRHQDLSMQSMFDWMHNHGYKLEISFFKSVASNLAKMINDMGFRDFGIASGMPRKTLQTMGMLRGLQKEILTAQVVKFEKEFLAKTGQIPAHKDIIEDLNRLRIEDCINFKNRKTVKAKVLFHHYFRPDNLTCD